jgi:hypothetical protein
LFNEILSFSKKKKKELKKNGAFFALMSYAPRNWWLPPEKKANINAMQLLTPPKELWLL